MPSSGNSQALARLEADGFLERASGRPRTTRRWQAAMMRAAAKLYGTQADEADLRLPVAMALLECYGADLSDREIADLTEAMLPIELIELSPL